MSIQGTCISLIRSNKVEELKQLMNVITDTQVVYDILEFIAHQPHNDCALIFFEHLKVDLDKINFLHHCNNVDEYPNKFVYFITHLLSSPQTVSVDRIHLMGCRGRRRSSLYFSIENVVNGEDFPEYFKQLVREYKHNPNAIRKKLRLKHPYYKNTDLAQTFALVLLVCENWLKIKT